jgi:NADH dehydrogenase
VETIAAVNDFAREALAFYPQLSADTLRMVLVHPGPVILPELSPKLGAYAQQKLAQRHVDIRVNTRVTGVSEHGVALSDGTTIPSHTLVWTAGTSPHPLLETLPCPKERGRLLVNEYMAVPEWPGVWALGDCALVPDRQSGHYYPPTAQHALREGKVVAQNLTAALRGGRQKPFVFATIGQLAAIGRRTGVASILGVNFSGFLAWWLWRTIYLSKLPRFEKKVRVALDWTLDLLFSKDIVQFTTVRAPTVSQAETRVPVDR